MSSSGTSRRRRDKNSWTISSNIQRNKSLRYWRDHLCRKYSEREVPHREVSTTLSQVLQPDRLFPIDYLTLAVEARPLELGEKHSSLSYLQDPIRTSIAARCSQHNTHLCQEEGSSIADRLKIWHSMSPWMHITPCMIRRSSSSHHTLQVVMVRMITSRCIISHLCPSQRSTQIKHLDRYR